jgi:hypothetical protein
MKFMLITNDIDLACYAESCGVERIFVDLEKLGKKERQGHLDTLISDHSIEDVAIVKKNIVSAELLVRLNPLHSGTKTEIEAAIDGGADFLMLPMFYSADEVQTFSDMVNGRAGVIPLIETYPAVQSIDDIVCVSGVSEIYIGLNDLHLDMNLTFMFEPLANGLIDNLAKTIKSAGLPFGFGGIARVGEGVIPGELVLAEHLRLGSSSVILSRTFHRKSENILEFQANLNLKIELEKLFSEARKLKLRTSLECIAGHQKLKKSVEEFVENKK